MDVACPIKPIDDRVVFVWATMIEKSEGGIHLPNALQEKTKVAQIVAVGPGALVPSSGERRPVDLSVGDVVLPGRQIEYEFYYNTKTYYVIRAMAICGKLEGVEVEPV